MSNKSKKPASPAPSPTQKRSHKFPIGAFVVMDGGANNQASFKITGHMPDGGAGPQYRIKSERESYERVTTESRLAPLQR